LLKELARATPAEAAIQGGIAKAAVSSPITRQTEPPSKSPYAQAIADAGVSRQRANRMEALANVPAHEFEAALIEPVKPSVSAILERVRTAPTPPRFDDNALFFWGRLRDFERMGIFGAKWDDLLFTMTDTMRRDMQRLVPLLHELTTRLIEDSHELT
jgi:hypothetical protein